MVLATNVYVDQPGHDALHNEERTEINAIRASIGNGGSAVFDFTNPAYGGGMGPNRTASENGAALQATLIAANGSKVTGPAGDYPCAGAKLIGANSELSVNIEAPGAWFCSPNASESVLYVERTPATPIAVGATYLMWWGPFQPSGIARSGLMQVIPATGLNRFKGGRVYHISSRDIYPWAWSAQNVADYSTSDNLVFQAEQFPLLGIGVVVSSVANGGPSEQMMVQGSSSGAQGLVASALLGNTAGGITATQAHITFTSVTGDFVNGENLVRIAGGNPTGTATVGQVVGVVTGPPVLLTTDIFVLQYGRTTSAQVAGGTATPVQTDTTVQLREVNTKPTFRLRGVGFDTIGGDPDAYATNRTGALQMRGVYAPDVEYRVRNGWSRAVQAWSIYMGRWNGFIDQMANHAMLDQSAFGYGLELKAGCKANDVTMHGLSARHIFTDNTNQRSWSLANNNAAGKWTQWDYGTPIRTTVRDFVIECSVAPGMDTHTGNYYTTFENGRIFGGGSGGRFSTDNGSAAQSRGFGTKWINVEVDASTIGFLVGGVGDDAGINHRCVLKDCHVSGALANAVYAPDAKVPGQATIEIDGGSFSGRTSYTDAAGGTQQMNARYYQALIQIGDGVNLEVRGEPLFRKFSGTWLLSKGTGSVNVYSAAVDYRECPSSATGLRIEAGTGGSPTIKVYSLKLDGTPSTIFRNVSGDSRWVIGDVLWGGPGTYPSTAWKTVNAGAPTFDPMAKLTVV